MKKLSILFTFCFLLFAVTVKAQIPPTAFNYSAVARNAQNNPIANTTIGIQITIVKTSALGTAVYSENHFVNTDQFGLFNLTVGAGAVQSGSMSTIDWSNDNYYLKVGMDANGGTNFLTMGTTQLLSVPYALYAKSAGSVSGGTGLTIDSVSSTGDTLFLSNGQTFIAGVSGGGTNGTLASVTTVNATNVLNESAILGGNITASGGELVLSRGVCVSNTVNPTVDDIVINMGSGTGTFTGGASGLQAGSTYHVRAYATNSKGTAYGNNVNFTTQADGVITALSCGNATNIGTLTAGVSASGASSVVPYTGGNGGIHSGQTINSTGITGLTATLSWGNFANGAGNLTYTITGTPSAAGTANFALNIGGQVCTLSRSVMSIVSNPGAGVTFNGYTYASIVLGNGQEWMAENLRTTNYANGDPIPNVIDGNQWQNLTTGAWAHIFNDSQYENPYGKLYNWYAVADLRNVCPTGWHVPTDAEWTVLTDYLGGTNVAGGKMKSTGTQYWVSPNTDATNESGFSGTPGGFRNANGVFNNLGGSALWWSSTEYNTGVAWLRELAYSLGSANVDINFKDRGLSVRCLRD